MIIPNKLRTKVLECEPSDSKEARVFYNIGAENMYRIMLEEAKSEAVKTKKLIIKSEENES